MGRLGGSPVRDPGLSPTLIRAALGRYARARGARSRTQPGFMASLITNDDYFSTL
jgi:hypothetical protein